MSRIVRFAGASSTAIAGLTEPFHAAGFVIEAGPSAAPPSLLVTLMQTADDAIAAAADFARFQQPEAGERLVVNIWPIPRAPDWDASRRAATMVAYTRHAAIAWAGRGVRINAVTFGGSGDEFGAVPAHEVAATILALWRWQSMTGQIVHLAA